MADPKVEGVITSTPEEQSMAHRGIISLMLALLVKKKVINRQIIERRLQAMIDHGPEARMTPGVLDEVALVRHLMRAMLDDDDPVH
ncbi:hypothetical protein MKK84_24680 [Methylobacterium sp. E-065]|uniref:hypothetical protein n=1 Tax=Methylobacterium sp. E-065 TaxID=2836583 RepID=UPI001FBB5CBD|nr:hypothetical protein [Methylobacterium sp. E-065]MCJ2020585.1 hypothetical protein [Methylobacterium sp. E-065]